MTKSDLKDIRQTYNDILANDNESMRLALSRLNGCMMRADDADAILDGTIGLELLLGDSDPQATSFKLRMRAAALTHLDAGGLVDPQEMIGKVKRLYEARSKIVHGHTKKKSKNVLQLLNNEHKNERRLAYDLLRYVIKILLKHPHYINPIKLDSDLLSGDLTKHRKL
ncbi:hypothetical protein [Amaricoccus tamworthensis]|uniref:hypothetical protein n=1 Tax=Amaricoccus tamworthensis TaxID=57002 RepID=UPI003C7CEABD